MTPPPNIIFIFADDWGYGDLSCHGSDFVETPNLDRMASEGIDFQNFLVNSPVCSPSRAAVLTGQFPAKHCIHRHFSTVENHAKCAMPDWLDPNAAILPRLLRNNGYVTGHFGKWHLTGRNVDDAPLPTEYGYDEYGAFNLPGKQIETSETCPRAIDFIRRHRDQPFFLNVWIHETHLPHYPRNEFMDQFTHLDERKQVYAAVVAEGDAGVGALLDKLKNLDLDANTLVIFSSDNGPEMPGKETQRTANDAATGAGLGRYYSVGTTAGLKGRKRSLFAGGVRVPFIARWPGVVPAGQTDRTSVISAVDLLPTFLELADIPTSAHLKADGQSIVRALKGQPFKREAPIFWEWTGHHRRYCWPHLGILDGPWKLMINQELDAAELYNVESDWAERNNVAEANPDMVNALTKAILAWKDDCPAAPPAHCISSLRDTSKT